MGNAMQPEMIENQRLAQTIDHTKLTFEAGEDEKAAIVQLCSEAEKFGFYAVCVRPQHVLWAKESLKDKPVHIAVVVGFPSQKVKLENELNHATIGKMPTSQKIAEAQQAIQEGADELDWVISVEDLKMDVMVGKRKVFEELSKIRQHWGEITVKVIIETDLLTSDEIVSVTRSCVETGMTMVKTSTGMVEGGSGATVENVQLIDKTLKMLNANAGIKASGGIKTREKAVCFLNLGVNRLGTSSGVNILKNALIVIEEACY